MNKNLFSDGRRCIALILFFLAGACGNNSQQAKTPATQSGEAKPVFRLPVIPAVITTPVERADYLVGHYWTHFDFSDTTLIHQPQITEQAFVDFINILPHASAAVVRSSIHHTLEQAQADPKMFKHFTDLFEKYLYDPNAPMRNEDHYMLVLEYILDSPQIDDLDKIRPAFQWEQLNKNRAGTIAADFTYATAGGRQESLRNIKSEYLMIFFNNPGCEACGEIQRGFERSPVIAQMMEKGRLKILAMYIDEDLASWEQYRPTIPAQWINAYDPLFIIKNENLYDLRAIPNLYLLDKDKRVILKDARPEQIEEWLVTVINTK